MTDDEIRQSKIDHGHHAYEIMRTVIINTPSRVGWMHMNPKNRYAFFYDFANDVPIRRHEPPRR